MENVIQTYQGKSFIVTLESMLASTNCGWCLMSMSEHIVLSGQSNLPLHPGISPVNQNFHFIAVGDCQNPDEVILKFGLFNFSQSCPSPLRTVEYKVSIIPSNNDTLDMNVVNTWNSSRSLTEEDMQVFNEALKSVIDIGVKYTPLSVQSQVAVGTNYRFLCKATIFTPEAQTTQVLMTVYKPVPNQGEAYITSITELPSSYMFSEVFHLDNLNVDTRSSLKQFVTSLANCRLEKGSLFSGTVYMKDLPADMYQAEVQGVIGYHADRMLVDMTLTSLARSSRWTCSCKIGVTEPKWVERK